MGSGSSKQEEVIEVDVGDEVDNYNDLYTDQKEEALGMFLILVLARLRVRVVHLVLLNNDKATRRYL